MPKIERLDHVGLVVSDLKKSVAWYKDIFGLTPVYVDEWWTANEAFLGSGETIVALFQDTSNAELPLSRNLDGCHNAFRTDRDSFNEYRKLLGGRGIELEYADYGTTKSLYFHDPDGYQLEITTYEV